MGWEFLDRFEFRQYLVQLVFREPAHFHWFHGPAISALLCRAVDRHPLGPDIAPYPVESGTIDYCENERYNFGVTLFGKTAGRIERIGEGLRREGATPYPEGGIPRFDVASIHEPSCAPFEGKGALSEYDLRLLTPLRMERKNPPKGKRYFDTSFFDGGRFLRLLYDRVYDLAKLGGCGLPPYAAPEVPETAVADMELLWVDAPYHGGEKTCGGVIGAVRLSAVLDERWQRLLYAGQIAHAGRNASLGFGVYSCAQLPVENSMAPARSLIGRIVGQSNLEKALEHIKSNSGADDADNETAVGCGEDFDCSLEALAGKVNEGSYEPGLLRGIVIPKSTGKGVRALAVPPLPDRVLQRAACQVLGPGIDMLLEESSFAYRKGLSRKSAAHAIDRARREGYGFALCSDINAFFDTVSWDRIERKLHALYREPALVGLLVSWMRRDVSFQGRTIKRSAGLPQGAAVSPLLANLYLDEFDEALGAEFKLIRYADDFVVLCRSEEEAKKALDRAREALGRLALEVRNGKTDVVDFERGFQYLGYLFCRSLIVERKKTECDAGDVRDPPEDAIPPGSWLTHVDFRKTRALENPPAAAVRKINEEKAAGSVQGVTVYLSDPDILVRLSGGTLVLSHLDDPEAGKTVVPIRNIAAVVDYGRPSMTVHALTELGRRGIPVYFCESNGEMYLPVPGLAVNYDLWTLQERCRRNEAVAAAFVRAVVCAKIRNYGTLCRRQEWTGDASDRLKALEEKCASCADADSARGYEGKAAAIWFSLVKDHLDPRWGFSGRARHPASDPVNAMLSFGYSCLYHHISTALQMRGLNPGIGWFHESRPNYHALACDLQEEFRHLVDSLVLFMVHRNMVSPDCFVSDASGSLPCLMKKEFRKVFLERLEEKLLTEFTPDGEEQAINYRDYFLRQARQIEEICRNPDKPYYPLRIR